jgi:membrane fusion protein (multidrug efflux system)
MLVLGLALLAGCAKEEAGGGFSMPPMPVEVAVVTEGPVVDRFTGVGSIEAGEEITVVSEIDALVVKLPFVEGQAIRTGGLIAQLDDAELRAQVARAEALRDQQQITFDRVKAVVDQGAGAPQDLDNAAATLKVAEANLDVALAKLSKTRITAPFDGILGTRRVSPGAFLRAGTTITDLAQIHRIKVTFTAPERFLGRLLHGARVSVSTTAYPDHVFTGAIDVIEPQLDASTRSARILARVDNPEQLFRPGMSADVSVVLGERSQALTVPSEAVFVEGQQAFVYVVGPDSVVVRTPLTLGTRLPHLVEVLSGLESGAMVVRAGHQKLFPGAKVMPITPEGPGGPPGTPGGSEGSPGGGAEAGAASESATDGANGTATDGVTDKEASS